MKEQKPKLTKRQREIVEKMRDGYMLIIGRNETNGGLYYLVTEGMHNIYFNATVFNSLVSKGLIYQESRSPYDWLLTKLGEEI